MGELREEDDDYYCGINDDGGKEDSWTSAGALEWQRVAITG